MEVVQTLQDAFSALLQKRSLLRLQTSLDLDDPPQRSLKNSAGTSFWFGFCCFFWCLLFFWGFFVVCFGFLEKLPFWGVLKVKEKGPSRGNLHTSFAKPIVLLAQKDLLHHSNRKKKKQPSKTMNSRTPRNSTTRTPRMVCFMKVFRYVKPTKRHTFGGLGIFW